MKDADSVEHAFRHPGAQIRRHAYDFGVLAIVRDPVADVEAADAFTNLEYMTYVGQRVGSGGSSLLRTADRRSQPAEVPIFSSTCRTLSGCCLALSSQLARPNSSNIRSVPDETRE